MLTTNPRKYRILISAAMLSIAWSTHRAENVVADTAPELPQANFAIDRSDLQSPEWLAAIQAATQHQRGKGQYTLLRIKTVGFTSLQPTQLSATKLKELTPIDGGGSFYRTARSDEFVLWEHTNTGRRTRNEDPIEVGHIESGKTTLWIGVPREGTLNVLGDILVRPSSHRERSRLEISIEKSAATKTATAVIGPIVVGGPFGTEYPLNAEGKSDSIALAPGEYKILFPDFNVAKSRWDFTIRPGMTTHLKLKAASQQQLDWKEESHEKTVALKAEREP